MISFDRFLEHKRNDFVIKECANLMVEMDVNPYEYIYEFLKKADPLLAEGFLDGVKSFAGSLYNAGKAFVGDTAKGMRAGYMQARDAVSGPVAKFDAVNRALMGLVELLNTDPKLKDFQSSSGQPIGKYLSGVLASLQKDAQLIPKLYDTQVTQGYGSRADVDASRKGASPAPVPSGKDVMDMSRLSDPRYQSKTATANVPNTADRTRLQQNSRM